MDVLYIPQLDELCTGCKPLCGAKSLECCERSWVTYTRTFTTEGTHTVEWKYDKDGSVSTGSDCGWIDDVVWTPTGG